MAFVSDMDNYQIVPPPIQFGAGGCTLGIKVPRQNSAPICVVINLRSARQRN